jgi:hypothetical protein
MAIVKISNQKGEFVSEYYLDDRLKDNLDNKIIPSLHKKDKDCIICLDGREGSGKSTLAIQLGKYVDPTLDLNRIVFSPEDFRDAILKAKKGQCIIYDEAFTGFSSRSSLSPVNRVLVSLAMQMRQKNLFVIIVLPTIFLLDKYMAMFRTRFLIHVYENKGVRGYFKIYNSKKKKFLILMGAKTMTYHVKGLWTNFKGRFYGKFALGDDSIEKKYRKKKEKALADSEKSSMTSAQVKFREQRDLMIYLFRKFSKLGYREIEIILNDYDFMMSFQQIGKICSKYGDVLSELERKDKENKVKKVKTNDLDSESEDNEGIIEDIDDLDSEIEEESPILDEKDSDIE